MDTRMMQRAARDDVRSINDVHYVLSHEACYLHPSKREHRFDGEYLTRLLQNLHGRPVPCLEQTMNIEIAAGTMTQAQEPTAPRLASG